jgi:lysine 2,3-aminomutase
MRARYTFAAVLPSKQRLLRVVPAEVALPPEELPKPPAAGAAAAGRLPRFKIGHRALSFRRWYFPDATEAEWNDWRWQMRHRIKDLEGLMRVVRLSEDERTALLRHTGSLPVGISPYYTSLIDDTDATRPLRRTVIMVNDEYRAAPGEADDPLSEDRDSPVPGLVHRYPDRVLFLVTGTCPVYCRYCTRSRMVGYPDGEYRFNVGQWEAAIAYIASNRSIRDVLISGGDPLILSDDRLEWLLSRLRRIKHVEFLRIGSKVPATLPQRITPALTRMLKRYHPLFMSIHFVHPGELTPEVEQACARLADAGIPLGSQTVLLATVNDDAETLKALFQGLLRYRVRPYYLYQCDPVTGSSHFRVPVEKALHIVGSLRGHTTGYAVPTFVVDAPNGGGKIPLYPETNAGRDGDGLLLRNYQGGIYRYPDPPHGRQNES